MVEEPKPEEPKSAPAESFLDKVKAERTALENERIALEKVRDDLKELQSVNILSGKTEAGQTEKSHEETPKEYADRIMGITKK